jgi:hypothetical protein
MENSLLKPSVPFLTCSAVHVWTIPLSVREGCFRGPAGRARRQRAGAYNAEKTLEVRR